MNTLAPPRRYVLVMLLFALSCVGLLLFLWLSFGGTEPFAARGYRFTVDFPAATELGTQADVEIAGITIGKVTSVGLDHRNGLTEATLEIGSRYAPRPADTRAILRQKTLLGETYIELSGGNPRGPFIRDGGHLPQGQVSPTVQLDDILSTFDARTRRAFDTWLQQDGIAFTDRGQAFNAALAELAPFATNTDRVVTVLNRDTVATHALLADGAQTLAALTAMPASLRGLIENSNAVFSATNARNQALAAAIRAFPAFTTATQATIARLNSFAGLATPVIQELRPAAQQLSPALEATVPLAPELRDVLVDLGPLTQASRAGVPALEHFLTESQPLLARLTPYLGSVVPVVDYINAYRRELAAFFANGAADSEATGLSIVNSTLKHYLQVSAPVNPETLTEYSDRPSSNRSNPYTVPDGDSELLGGLPVFGSYLCTSHPLPTVPSNASPNGISADILTVLRNVYYTADPGGPPCRSQPALGATLGGETGLSALSGSYPHLQPLR